MPEDFPYALTAHAAKVIAEREISKDWVVLVLEHPVRTEPDRVDAGLRHSLAPIPEFGNRVLRVIYNPTVSPWLIVSVYFDRTQRGRL
ncbi:MAG: DUF4258 domain-containing protein [Nitrospirota bacterium]